VPIRLMPLDVTSKIIFTKDQVNKLKGSSNPGGKEIADILGWELNSFSPQGVAAWDLATAIDLTHPGIAANALMHVDVVTQQGNKEGQTVGSDQSPKNITECSSASTDKFRAALLDEF